MAVFNKSRICTSDFFSLWVQNIAVLTFEITGHFYLTCERERTIIQMKHLQYINHMVALWTETFLNAAQWIKSCCIFFHWNVGWCPLCTNLVKSNVLHFNSRLTGSAVNWFVLNSTDGTHPSWMTFFETHLYQQNTRTCWCPEQHIKQNQCVFISFKIPAVLYFYISVTHEQLEDQKELFMNLIYIENYILSH